jgi:hypothetical protein
MQEGGLEQFRAVGLTDGQEERHRQFRVGDAVLGSPSRWYADMSDCVVGLYSRAGDPDCTDDPRFTNVRTAAFRRAGGKNRFPVFHGNTETQEQSTDSIDFRGSHGFEQLSAHTHGVNPSVETFEGRISLFHPHPVR